MMSKKKHNLWIKIWLGFGPHQSTGPSSIERMNFGKRSKFGGGITLERGNSGGKFSKRGSILGGAPQPIALRTFVPKAKCSPNN